MYKLKYTCTNAYNDEHDYNEIFQVPGYFKVIVIFIGNGSCIYLENFIDNNNHDNSDNNLL